jgi:hypothetical protein
MSDVVIINTEETEPVNQVNETEVTAWEQTAIQQAERLAVLETELERLKSETINPTYLAQLEQAITERQARMEQMLERIQAEQAEATEGQEAEQEAEAETLTLPENAADPQEAETVPQEAEPVTLLTAMGFGKKRN